MGADSSAPHVKTGQSRTSFNEFRPASTGYADRPVAMIYGNVPISREEMGEYLIARLGKDVLKT